MTAKPGRAGAVPVSDLATALLDPVLRKRAGMTVGLVQSWDEIVGTRLAAATRPERIAWPRRMHEDDPFEPLLRKGLEGRRDLGWASPDCVDRGVMRPAVGSGLSIRTPVG